MKKSFKFDCIVEELKVFESHESIVTHGKLDRVSTHLLSKFGHAMRCIASSISENESMHCAAREAESSISSAVRFIERLDNRNFDGLKSECYKALALAKFFKTCAKSECVAECEYLQESFEKEFSYDLMVKSAAKVIEMCESCVEELAHVVSSMSILIDKVERYSRFIEIAA